MSEHDKRTTDGAATARRLGESGELVSRYQAAVGEHVGRMATVNADLRRELAGARAETHELRTILAATRDRLDNTIVDLSEAHDALDACARAVGRLRALLRRCEPFLATYQCEGQTEGDALIALAADIAAEQAATEGEGE